MDDISKKLDFFEQNGRLPSADDAGFDDGLKTKSIADLRGQRGNVQVEPAVKEEKPVDLTVESDGALDGLKRLWMHRALNTKAEVNKEKDTVAKTVGVPVSWLDNERVYAEAKSAAARKQRLERLFPNGVGEDALATLYKEYPWLQKVKGLNEEEGPKVILDAVNLHKAYGVIEAARAGWEGDEIHKERGGFGFEKMLAGGLNDADKEKLKELDNKVKDVKQIPGLFDAPLENVVGGLVSSGKAMGRQAVYGGSIGAVTVGGAAGLTAGGVAFAVTKNPAMAMKAAGRTFKVVAGKSVGYGMAAKMFQEEAGNYYLDFLGYKNKDGGQLMSNDEAALYAVAAGAAQALVEYADFGMVMKVLRGNVKGKALKEVEKVLAGAKTGTTALARIQQLFKDKGWDFLKVTGTEAAEESVQSVSDDFIKRIIAVKHTERAEKPDAKKGIDDSGIVPKYSFPEIFSRAGQNFIESLGVTAGFGAFAVGGSLHSGVRRVARMYEVEQVLGQETVKTVQGAEMLEKLGEFYQTNELAKESPELVDKVVKAQLEGTGFENVFVDTELVKKEEGGEKAVEILEQAAISSGMTEEEVKASRETGAGLVLSASTFAKLDPEVAKKLDRFISFSEGTDCLAVIQNRAKELQEKVHRVALKEAEDMRAGVQKAAKRVTGDAEEQTELVQVLEKYGENFKEGFEKEYENAVKERDEFVDGFVDEMAKGMKQGVAFITHEDWTHTYTSNNDRWYSEYVRANKKAPTKAEMRQLVLDAMAWNNPYGIGTYEDELVEAAEVYEDLNHRVEVLGSLRGKLDGVDVADLAAARELSKEGKEVYDKCLALLGKNGKRFKDRGVISAARANAMMVALYCDRMAEKWNALAGGEGSIKPHTKEQLAVTAARSYQKLHGGAKVYTALDYFRTLHTVFNQDLGTVLGGREAGVWNEEKYYKTEGERFVHDIDENKDKPSVLLDVCDTPVLLQNIPGLNVEALPVKVSSGITQSVQKDKNDKGKHSHGLTKDELAQIPWALQHPAMVLKSATVTGDIVIVTDIKDKDGNSVFVPLVLGQEVHGNNKKANIIKTMYGKDNEDLFIAKQALAQNILYVSKQKSSDLIASYRLQLPQGVIKQSSYVDDIVAKKQAEVNSVLEQSAWHGTPHSFEKFDLGAIGSGEGHQAHGWGLYFAQDKKIAQGYKERLSDTTPEQLKIDGKDFDDFVGSIERTTDGNKVAMLYDYQLFNDRQQNEIDSEKRFVEECKMDDVYSQEDVEWFEKEIASKVQHEGLNRGKLVEVDVPGDDVLLDEQKNLDKQPANVRKALRKIAKEIGVKWNRLDNGHYIYNNIKNVLGSDRAASELLNKYGIKGITYDGGTDGRCYVVFDDKAIEVINIYNQGNGTVQGQSGVAEPRVRTQGLIREAEMDRFVALLEHADASTFFHEFGHICYLDLEAMASNVMATEQMKKDFATVDGWTAWAPEQLKEYEHTSGYGQMAAIDKEIRESTGEKKEMALKRWKQERWARAVEEYVREGRVPSSALRRVLADVLKWLKKVYRGLKGAGVPMSKKVKDVMDRMLVSEEMVDAADVRAEAAAFEKAGGLELGSGSAREMWTKLYDEVHEAAEARVRKLVMGDLAEERQKKMEEARAEEREKVTELFRKKPHFVVQEFLGLNPKLDVGMLCSKAGITVEEYENGLKLDGGSVETAVDKYMRDVYEPFLQREFYVSEEEMRAEAEKALGESRYRSVLTAFESEMLDKWQRRFERLFRAEVKKQAEYRKERQAAEKAVRKQQIDEVVSNLRPADVEQLAVEVDDDAGLESLPKEGLLEKAKNILHGLIGKDIVDPLGNKVYFAPGATEDFDAYCLHLAAGANGKMEDVERRRVLGIAVAEQTIRSPWAIVMQKNGRKMYLAIYKTRNNNVTGEVVVGVEEGDEGRVVTSFVAEGKSRDKNNALRDFRSQVKRSDNVLYFGAVLSGHSRSAGGTEVSQGNAPLRSSVNGSVTYNGVDVNDLTPLERQKLREDAQRETIKQLKEELKKQKQATRQAALEVVRNCRKYAAVKMDELSLSQSANPVMWERLARQAQDRVTKFLNGQKYAEAANAKKEQLVYETMAAEAAERQKKLIRNNAILQNKVKNMKKEKNVEYNHRYLMERVMYLYRLVPSMSTKFHDDYIGPAEVLNRMLKNLTLAGADEAQTKANLPKWLEFVIFSDNPLATDNRVDGGFMSLTWAQYNELSDFLKNMYTAGRNAKRICSFKDDKGQEISIADATQKIMDESLSRNGFQTGNKGLMDNPTTREKLAKRANELFVMTIKPEELVDRLGETARKLIYEPLKHCFDREDKMMADMKARINSMFDSYAAKKLEIIGDKAGRKFLRGIYSENRYKVGRNNVTHEQLLCLALNWGNVKNRQRVCDGYGVEEADVFYALKNLDSADWELVKGFWKLFADNYDDYNKCIINTTGVAMGKVEATPFTVLGNDGVLHGLEGGYYPIVYDRTKSERAEERSLDEAVRSQLGGAQRIGMGIGSSKSRAKGRVMEPVLLSLDGGMQKAEEVVHAICFRETCCDLFKLVNQNQDFQTLCTGALGKECTQVLNNWVLDSWHTDIRQLNAMDRLMAGVRHNVTSAVLGFRTMTALVNFANVAVAMNYVGPVNYLKSVVNFYRRPSEQWQFVKDKSVFMRDRAESLDRDVREVLKQSPKVSAAGNKIRKGYDWVNEHAFRVIAFTDFMGSAPAWVCAYEAEFRKCVDAGLDAKVCEQRAVDAGDEVVRRSYGSGRDVDLAEVQKGGRNRSEAVKMLTMYYSFMSTLHNGMYHAVQEAKQQGNKGKDRWMPVVKYGFYAYFLNSLIENLIRSQSGDDDGDDKVGFLGKVGLMSADLMAGGFPVVRDVVGSVTRILAGERVMGSRGHAVVQFGDDVVQLLQQLSKGADTAKVLRTMGTVTSTVTGISKTLLNLPSVTAEFVENGDFSLQDWEDFAEAAAMDKTIKRVRKETGRK